MHVGQQEGLGRAQASEGRSTMFCTGILRGEGDSRSLPKTSKTPHTDTTCSRRSSLGPFVIAVTVAGRSENIDGK